MSHNFRGLILWYLAFCARVEYHSGKGRWRDKVSWSFMVDHWENKMRKALLVFREHFPLYSPQASSPQDPDHHIQSAYSYSMSSLVMPSQYTHQCVSDMARINVNPTTQTANIKYHIVLISVFRKIFFSLMLFEDTTNDRFY